MQEEDQTASVPADFQHLARLTGRNGWRHTLCFPPLPFPFPSGFPGSPSLPNPPFHQRHFFQPEAPSVGKFGKSDSN